MIDNNWLLLLERYESLIGQIYTDIDGNHWEFYGLMHGEDDYYFVMLPIWEACCKKPVMFISCAVTIEMAGFELAEED